MDKYCQKHNCKMIQLFSSWACDVCDGKVNNSLKLAENNPVNTPYIVPAANGNPEMIYCRKCWELPMNLFVWNNNIESYCNPCSKAPSFTFPIIPVSSNEYLCKDGYCLKFNVRNWLQIRKINFQLTCPTCQELPGYFLKEIPTGLKFTCENKHSWESNLIEGQLFKRQYTINTITSSYVYEYNTKLQKPGQYPIKTIAVL